MIEHACTQQSIIVKHQSPPISTSIAKLCFRSISDSLFPITGREIIFLIRRRISRGWIILDNWVASTRRQWFLSLSPFVMPGPWPIEKAGRISNDSVSYSSLPFPYNICQRSKISSINSGCIVPHVSSRRFFFPFPFLSFLYFTRWWNCFSKTIARYELPLFAPDVKITRFYNFPLCFVHSAIVINTSNNS